MAINPDDFQNIVSAVLSSVRTNSRTIDQLTPVTSLSDSDSIEISGGKKVSYKILKDLIKALSQSEIDILTTQINKSQLKSCLIVVDEDSASLIIASNGKTIRCSIPIATKEKAGFMSASDKALLSSVGEANGIAPLGPDGKVPAANLPATSGAGVKEVIEFSSVVSDVEDIADTTTLSSTSTRCSVVYDADRDIFLLRFLRLGGFGPGELGPGEEVKPYPGEAVMPAGLGEMTDAIIDPIGPTLTPYYYRSWADAGDFGSVTTSGVKPASGRIYVSLGDCRVFICKSAKLESVGGGSNITRITESEIDEMFN